MGCSIRAVAVIESALVFSVGHAIGTELHTTVEEINPALNPCGADSPFRLENEQAYQAWRARKLARRGQVDPARVFTLDSEGRLPPSACDALQAQLEAFNFVLFEASNPDEFDKQAFVELNRQFGLSDPDANLGADADRVTALRVVDATDARAQYIPYTNRAMNWHTDGYYNPPERRINAFALYCVNPARRGGGNYLFDHEMMYLLIRDRSPDLLEALMQDDLMHIPANLQGKHVIRREESGPVFSLQANSAALNMRYTSRPHNIVWKSDRRSQRALNLVREILLDGEALIDVSLQAGQGIVCNNILHGRHAFQDAANHVARLVLRVRYRDAINLAQGLCAENPG
jgi:hypothetical protein